MFTRFCVHFASWRQALKEYCTRSDTEVKVDLIKLFYGARPINDLLPFMRKLCAEVRAAAAALVAHPASACFSTTYADRKNPLFSRMSAILSFAENDLLTKAVTKIKGQSDASVVLL